MSSVERMAASPNDRLRQALIDAELTPEQLAKKVEVDPKTVERWIANGRVPYPVHQFAVEQAVGTKASELWPGRRPNVTPLKDPEKENSRLREAFYEARLSYEQAAEKVGVDPKTVERWVTRGRVPFPVVRQAVSVVVGVPEAELWPEATAQRCQRGYQPHSPQVTADRPAPHAGIEGPVVSTNEPPRGHWTTEVPEGWRRVEQTNVHGVRSWGLEKLPSAAPAKPLAAVCEMPETERQPQTNAVAESRMRELMSWVPTSTANRSPLANYQPGSALARLANDRDRDGVER
ncbi:hypothetical protein ACW2Q0_29105 [Nocardia sp. R16R-3T]